MNESKDPIVIAGGGPTGLTLALALARADIPVIVLEVAKEQPADFRAATFHPPTVEILGSLGVADEMHRSGLIVSKWQFRDRIEGIVAEFDLGLLSDETAYPYRLHLEQHCLSAMILERLLRHPRVDYRSGCRVTGLTAGADRVAVRFETENGAEDLQASWLIGADGAKSVVRKSAAIGFEGFTWPSKFLVASMDTDLEQLGFAKAAYIADPDHWAATFKVPHFGRGLWRIAYGVDNGVDESELTGDAAVFDRLETIFEPLGLTGHEFKLEYRSIYRVHQRVAETFRKGRVLLAGDAAHINNPLGGFGLNAGIQDAANLAHKLIRQWRGEADARIMDDYDSERRPINLRTVQRMSIRNKRLIQMRDSAERRQQLNEMRQIAADPERAKAFLMDTSMINSVRGLANQE